MKKGIEYVHSPEKRRRDIRIGLGMLPVAWSVQLGLGISYLFSEGRVTETVFAQQRLGIDDDLFGVFKLRTLKQQGDKVRPINRLSAFVRDHGFDELIQAHNIIYGDMSVFGRRPLLQEDRDEAYQNANPKLVDRHRELVVPTKPGIVSSFGIESHKGLPDEVNGHDMRLELDIKDVVDASPKYDFGLLKQLIASVDDFVI